MSEFDINTQINNWIFFDLGNVLIDFEHERVTEALVNYFPKAQRNNALTREIHEFIFMDHGSSMARNDQMDRGARDLNWLTDEINKHFAITVPNDAFETIWFSIFFDTLNELPIRAINELKEAGIRVAICSSTNAWHWNPLYRKHPELESLCDRNFLSFELKSIKTDPGFFQARAREIGVPCDHILLVDDKPENCDAAKAAGAHAVRYKPHEHEKSLATLREFVETRNWRKQS